MVLTQNYIRLSLVLTLALIVNFAGLNDPEKLLSDTNITNELNSEKANQSIMLAPLPPCASGGLGGTVFIDFNFNGDDDGDIENGIENIEVRLYKRDGSGTTVLLETQTTDANGQIAVALDTAEPTAVTNSADATRLTDAATTVKIGPGFNPPTGNNQSILYVDTDALLIQAGETPTSTVGTPVYYDTPFNTSAFTGALSNGGDTTVLNAALNSSSFPNSSNALMSVVYSVVPLSGNGSTDATCSSWFRDLSTCELLLQRRPL